MMIFKDDKESVMKTIIKGGIYGKSKSKSN